MILHKNKKENPVTFEEIQNVLRRQATGFETGGFRPTNQPNESWIGKFFLFREDEEVPIDENGDLMQPLCQLYLPDLPYVPAILEGTTVLCVFMTLFKFDGSFSQDYIEVKNLPDWQGEPMGKRWFLREYPSLDGLVVKTPVVPQTIIKPFPLKPVLLDNDYPLWEDDSSFPEPVFKELVRLNYEGFFGKHQDSDKSKWYSYRMPNDNGHKVGGYPSYCQSGTDYGEGFEFAFQIASDNKARLNIVDGGQSNFAKNKNTGEWKLYYDFY